MCVDERCDSKLNFAQRLQSFAAQCQWSRLWNLCSGIMLVLSHCTGMRCGKNAVLPVLTENWL